jgi:hypothetical protein
MDLEEMNTLFWSRMVEVKVFMKGFSWAAMLEQSFK